MEATLTAGHTDLARRIDRIKLDDGMRVSGWIGYIADPKELPVGTKVKHVPGYKVGLQFEKA